MRNLTPKTNQRFQYGCMTEENLEMGTDLGA